MPNHRGGDGFGELARQARCGRYGHLDGFVRPALDNPRDATWRDAALRQPTPPCPTLIDERSAKRARHPASELQSTGQEAGRAQIVLEVALKQSRRGIPLLARRRKRSTDDSFQPIVMRQALVLDWRDLTPCGL